MLPWQVPCVETAGGSPGLSTSPVPPVPRAVLRAHPDVPSLKDVHFLALHLLKTWTSDKCLKPQFVWSVHASTYCWSWEQELKHCLVDGPLRLRNLSPENITSSSFSWSVNPRKFVCVVTLNPRPCLWSLFEIFIFCCESRNNCAS